MAKTFDIRLRRGRGRGHRVDNALNRLATEDGPATLRVELQCYLPRRRNPGRGRPEYQRMGATFLVDCKNNAALAYVGRRIRECLNKLDRVSIAEVDAGTNLGQASESPVEEVHIREADCAPLVEARKGETMASTLRVGSPGGPQDRRKHVTQSTVAPQANIAANCCPACGQLRGTNALACFECLTARARIASGRI